jgi:hypothetical protein
MGRGANPFHAITQPSHELMVAHEVYLYQGDHRHYSWSAIFKDVAAEHSRTCDDGCKKPMTVATVKRYWYRHALSVIPPHIIKRALSQKLDDILR